MKPLIAALIFISLLGVVFAQAPAPATPAQEVSAVPNPPQMTNETVMAEIGQLNLQNKANVSYIQTLIAKINEMDTQHKKDVAEIDRLTKLVDPKKGQ